jgi:hypothetical protein
MIVGTKQNVHHKNTSHVNTGGVVVVVAVTVMMPSYDIYLCRACSGALAI